MRRRVSAAASRAEQPVSGEANLPLAGLLAGDRARDGRLARARLADHAQHRGPLESKTHVVHRDELSSVRPGKATRRSSTSRSAGSAHEGSSRGHLERETLCEETRGGALGTNGPQGDGRHDALGRPRSQQRGWNGQPVGTAGLGQRAGNRDGHVIGRVDVDVGAEESRGVGVQRGRQDLGAPVRSRRGGRRT